jgi:hypothetical protein
MDLTEMGFSGMDQIDLAQDRDQWRALVNTVMSLWIAKKKYIYIYTYTRKFLSS